MESKVAELVGHLLERQIIPAPAADARRFLGPPASSGRRGCLRGLCEPLHLQAPQHVNDQGSESDRGYRTPRN